MMISQSGPTNAPTTALASLLYVSRVAVDPDQLAWALADIATTSMARNTASDITGLLIAAPRYFAQYMEGPPDALDAVMAQVLTDRRHDEIRIVRRQPITRRLGGSWRLIRFDPGSFEERHVTPVLEHVHRDATEAHGAALMSLIIRLLARTGDPAGPEGPARHAASIKVNGR